MPDQFLVSISADESPEVFAQIHVTQNKLQASIIPDSYSMPHWPQPGIVRRDLARGDMFSSIAYFGGDSNIAAELRAPEWQYFLETRGLDWHVRDTASEQNSDFSDVDAVIGVRSFQRAGFIRKPASKLFNAWIAGVPAILGREFAFREQRQGPLDYIEVSSFAEACAAVDRLSASPELRRAMIDNGLRRATEVSTTKITDMWESFLFETAQELAKRWFSFSSGRRQLFFWRCVFERKIRGLSYKVLHAANLDQYTL